MRTIFAVLFSLSSILLLIWIEQGLGFPYVWKTIAKIVLLLFVPLIFFRYRQLHFLHFKKTDRKSILVGLAAGLFCILSMLGVFIVLAPSIDIDALVADLASKGVTPEVFPFIALYILFGNSFIEEFFFRGILAVSLRNSKLRLILPSFFFAIYHIAIFLSWFSIPLLLIAIIGLWIGGIIFQLANERSGTILSSWIIHMSADIGVLLVGFYMIYLH